jgi:tetratricopeptide (TPR) repeat protein
MYKIFYLFVFIFLSLSCYSQEDDFTISQTDLNRANTFYNNALNFGINGKYEEAITAYTQAISLNPYNLDYYKNRALIKKEQQDFNGALSDLNMAQALDSTLSEIYYLKGNIFQDQEELEKASEMYTMAIYCYNRGDHSLNPFSLFFNRANTYLKRKLLKRALQDYNIALRLHPKHYPSYCNRGVARYQLQDKQGALADWEIASQGGIQQAKTYIEMHKEK